MANRETTKRGTGWRTIVGGAAGCLGLCIAAASCLFGLYEISTETPLLDLMFGRGPLRITAPHRPAPGTFTFFIPDGVNPETIPNSDATLDGINRNHWEVIDSLYGENLRTEITSLSRNEWIKLENAVLIKIENYDKCYKEVDVGAPPIGGIGYVRHFYVKVGPSQSDKPRIERAIFDPKDEGDPWTPRSIEQFLGGEEVPDFFTLSPGELEVFLLRIDFEQPGVYEFSVGIEYTYQGKTRVSWAKQKASAHIPWKMRVWQQGSNGHLELDRKCEYVQVSNGTSDMAEYKLECQEIPGPP